MDNLKDGRNTDRQKYNVTNILVNITREYGNIMICVKLVTDTVRPIEWQPERRQSENMMGRWDHKFDGLIWNIRVCACVCIYILYWCFSLEVRRFEEGLQGSKGEIPRQPWKWGTKLWESTVGRLHCKLLELFHCGDVVGKALGMGQDRDGSGNNVGWDADVAFSLAGGGLAEVLAACT